MEEIISNSIMDTADIAKKVASELRGGDVLALIGDLGGGKTTFTKSLAYFLGVPGEIQSPTFNIIKEYKASKRNIKKLYHMDFYRLECEAEFLELGIDEKFADKEAVSVVEWADKGANFLPLKTKFIEFDFIDENKRKVVLK